MGDARDEADLMNWFWDWGTARIMQGRWHPWYAALGHELRAIVRSYGREVKP